jgi:hypothetical protein
MSDIVVFRDLTSEEFTVIRNNERAIMRQLVQHENLYVDPVSRDLVFDELGKPKVASYAKPRPINLPASHPDHAALNGQPNIIPFEVHDGFSDVFGLDNAFIKHLRSADRSIKQPKYLGCFINNRYVGGTWYFSDQQYVGMYGIRTSLRNYLLREHRQISDKILHEIIRIAAGRTVVVPWPLESMLPILRRFDFIEHNSNEPTPERQFLAPYTGTSNYWTYQRSRSEGSH